MCNTSQINKSKTTTDVNTGINTTENKMSIQTESLSLQGNAMANMVKNSALANSGNEAVPLTKAKKVALKERREYVMIEKWYNTFLRDTRNASESYQNVKYAFFALKEGMDNPETDLKEYAKLLSDAYYAVKIYYEGHRTYRYTKKGKERQSYTKLAMEFLKNAVDYLNTELVDKRIVIKKDIDPAELLREQEYVVANGFGAYATNTKPWNEQEKKTVESSKEEGEESQTEEQEDKKEVKKATGPSDTRLEWQLKPYQAKIKELLKNHMGKTDSMSQKIFQWEVQRYNENVQMNLATLKIWVKDKCLELGYVGLEDKMYDYVNKLDMFDPLANPADFNEYIEKLDIQGALFEGAAETIEKKEKIIALMDKTKDNAEFWRSERVKKTLLQLKKEEFDVFYEVLKERVSFARNLIQGLVSTGFSELTKDTVTDRLEDMMLQNIFLENPTVIRSRVLTVLDTPAVFMDERKQEQNLDKAISTLELDPSYKTAVIRLLLKDKAAWTVDGHGDAEVEKMTAHLRKVQVGAVFFEGSLMYTKKRADGFSTVERRKLTREQWKELYQLKNLAGESDFKNILDKFYKDTEEKNKEIDASELVEEEEFRKLSQPVKLESRDELVNKYYYKNILSGAEYLGGEAHKGIKPWLKMFRNNIDELLFDNQYIKDRISGLKNISSLEEFEGLPYNEFKKIAVELDELVGSFDEVLERLNNEEISATVKRSMFVSVFKGEVTKENYQEIVDKEVMRLAYMVQADEQTFNRHLLKGKKKTLIINPKGSQKEEYVDRIKTIVYADEIWQQADKLGYRKQLMGLIQLPSFKNLFMKHAIKEDLDKGFSDAYDLLSQEKYKVKEGKIKKPKNVLKKIMKMIQAQRGVWLSKKVPDALELVEQLKLCGMEGDLFSPGGEYEDILEKSEKDYKKLKSNLGNNMLKRTLDMDELLEMKKKEVNPNADEEPILSKEDQQLLRDRMSSLLAGIRTVTSDMSQEDIEKIQNYNIRHFGVKNWDEAKERLRALITSAYNEALKKRQAREDAGEVGAVEKIELFEHGDIGELNRLIMGKAGGANGENEVKGRVKELTEILPSRFVDFMLENREEWSKILIHSDQEFEDYKKELKEKFESFTSAVEKIKYSNFYSEFAVDAFIDEFHKDIIKGDMKKIAKACSVDDDELTWEKIISQYDNKFVKDNGIEDAENAIRKAYGNNHYNFAADILRQRIVKTPELKAVLYNKAKLNSAIKLCNEVVKLNTQYMPKISEMSKIFGDEIDNMDVHALYDAYKEYLNNKMFEEDPKVFAKKIQEAYPQAFINEYKEELKRKEKEKQEKLDNMDEESRKKFLERNDKKSMELLKAGEKAKASVLMVNNKGIKLDQATQDKLSRLRFCNKNNIPFMTRLDLLSEEKMKKIKAISEDRNKEAVDVIDKILKRAAKKNLVKKRISEEVTRILVEKWSVDHDFRLNVPVVGAVVNKITAKVNEYAYRDTISSVAGKLQDVSDLLKKDKDFNDIKDKNLALIYYYKFKGDSLENKKEKLLKDPVLLEYKEREKLYGELENLKVENRYLALEKTDFMENLRVGMVNLVHREFLDLGKDRLRYFKFADVSYKAMEKAVGDHPQKERILTGLRSYSKAHILLNSRNDKEANPEEEEKRYREILADEHKLKYIMGGDSVSYADKVGLDSSYQGQYNHLDLEKAVMSMHFENTKDYLAARVKGTGFHNRRQGFFGLNEEEKKLFAIAITLINEGSADIGITKYVKKKDNEDGKLLKCKMQVQKFLKTGKIDGDIDYAEAVLKLNKANKNFNVKLFDDAMKFTRFMIDKNERLNSDEGNILSDPERSIAFAEKYNDFKGIKKLSETKLKDEGDFKKVLLDQMDKDIHLKVNYKNAYTYVREGIGHVKEHVWVKQLKERVENFTPVELHMFIMLLQDRTIFDVSQDEQQNKFKSKKNIGYVNERKRLALFASCVQGGEQFDKLFAQSSGANFMQHALKTMCSFQLKDGVDYYNKTLEEKDFVNSSIVRTSKFDWLLIKRAINFIDDAKATRNRNQLVSNTADYIMYSGNQKAINEYKKYEVMSKQKGAITQNTLGNFIMENAQKDMESNEDIPFLVGRISSLNKQELALFVRALAHRDILDLSKKNFVKNVVGKGERDYQNKLLRNKLLDDHMINGMGGNFEALKESDYFEAIKGMLSTQINDDKKLRHYKNGDVAKNTAAERNLIQQRDTAIDWKLVRRALLFVTDAKQEMDTYMEHREMYRMLGDLKKGPFDFKYGLLRKNTEMTFGSMGRFFSISSQPVVNFVETDLKNEIKKLNLDRLSGFIFSCVSEESLNKLNFVSELGDGQQTDFIDVVKGKVKDKINDIDYIKNSDTIKFVTKNLGMDNITDATKFLSDGRSILNVDELKDTLTSNAPTLLLNIGKKIVGVEDEEEEEEEETTEETEEETTEDESTAVNILLSVKNNGSEFRSKLKDITKDLNSLNGIFKSGADNAAQFESDRIKKQQEEANKTDKKETKKKKEKQPDKDTMKALKEISEELQKEDEKSSWDYLKEGDNIKKMVKDNVKRWISLDKLGLEEGMLSTLGSLIEKGIDEAVGYGIDFLVDLGKDYLEKGQEFIEGKITDLGNFVTEKFVDFVNEKCPDQFKSLASMIGVALGKFTNILASGKKYLDMGIKLLKAGKNMVLGVMNINYLMEEYERAEEEREKDQDNVKKAMEYNEQKDITRSKLLGRGYLKSMFNSDMATEHFATDDQVMSVINSVGQTLGVAAGMAGSAAELSDIAAAAIRTAVQTAFSIINAIVDHISSKNIIKDFLDSEEGKKVIEEAKKGRKKTQKYLGNKKVLSYEQAEDRVLVQKHLGYGSEDSFAKALGKQAVVSLLFSASKFNGLNGERIIATAIMHIMGMSDSVGKYDDETANTLYERLVLHKQSTAVTA